MPADIIRLNKPMMLDMKMEFQKSAEELDEAMQEIANMAQTLEDGALLGDGGALLAQTLREGLHRKLAELRDKAEEMQRDIQLAINRFDEMDRGNATNISNV